MEDNIESLQVMLFNYISFLRNNITKSEFYFFFKHEIKIQFFTTQLLPTFQLQMH